MPFFLVDDQLHVSAKTVQLVDLGQVGMAALGLWTLAGSQSQAQVTEGLDGQVLPGAWRLLGDKRLFNKLARILVDVGLWEDRSSGDDGHQYHDWFDMGYTPKAKVAANRVRTKELKSPDIVNAVRARDGDHCRYCARKVDWTVRNGEKGGTYDHVIPGLAAGVTNLVVACLRCNRKKAQRTPEQARMTLLPPPNDPDRATESAAAARSRIEKTQSIFDENSHQSTDHDVTEPRNYGAEAIDGDGPFQPDDDAAGQKTAIPHRTRSGTRSSSGSGLGRGRVTGEVSPGKVGPAGEAPPTEPSPGRSGSPWHGYRGPPVDLLEPKCLDHGLDLPCPKCTADHYAQEANA